MFSEGKVKQKKRGVTSSWMSQPDSSVTYPEFVVMVKCVKQLDNVAVITFSQDVNLNDVVLQLLLTFSLDHFGCSQNSCLLVPGLKRQRNSTLNSTCLSNGRPVSWVLAFYFLSFRAKTLYTENVNTSVMFLSVNNPMITSPERAFFKITNFPRKY